jgi:hypothetical protein
MSVLIPSHFGWEAAKYLRVWRKRNLYISPRDMTRDLIIMMPPNHYLRQ